MPVDNETWTVQESAGTDAIDTAAIKSLLAEDNIRQLKDSFAAVKEDNWGLIVW